MKKLTLLLFSIMFISCYSDIEIEEKLDYTFDHDINCNDVLCAKEWVADNIKPQKDSDIGVFDYWQLPHETYLTRKGDCEDYVILLMQLIYEIEPDSELYLVVVKTNTGSFHTILYYNGEYYEVRLARKYPLDEKKIQWMSTYGETI